jgi:hypothetical protein
MRIVRCCFLAVLVTYMSLPMVGCGPLFGYRVEKDADGNERVVADPNGGLADKAAGLLGLLGPWGIAAATAIGLTSKIVRHREIIARGQKDDDFDGVPDDQQNPPPPVNPS